MFTSCLLRVSFAFPSCLLGVYFAFTSCLLLLYFVFTSRLLRVYFVFTLRLLRVYFAVHHVYVCVVLQTLSGICKTRTKCVRMADDRQNAVEKKLSINPLFMAT